MADYIWKEKGNHLPLWDEVKIIDREELWRIRGLKEAVCSSHRSIFSHKSMPPPLLRQAIRPHTDQSAEGCIGWNIV